MFQSLCSHRYFPIPTTFSHQILTFLGENSFISCREIPPRENSFRSMLEKIPDKDDAATHTHISTCQSHKQGSLQVCEERNLSRAILSGNVIGIFSWIFFFVLRFFNREFLVTFSKDFKNCSKHVDNKKNFFFLKFNLKFKS